MRMLTLMCLFFALPSYGRKPIWDRENRLGVEGSCNDANFRSNRLHSILPNGRITYIGRAEYADYPNYLARFFSNGDIVDLTFGSGGVSPIIPGHLNNDMVSDGKTTLIGGIEVAPESDRLQFFLTRLTERGEKDLTFGMKSMVRMDFGVGLTSLQAIALREDRKILVAGFGELGEKSFIFVLLLNPDGSLDKNFGTDGVLKFQRGENCTINYGMAVLKNGDFFITGETGNDSNMKGFLVRVKSVGQIDESFGDKGWIQIDGGCQWEDLRSIAVSPKEDWRQRNQTIPPSPEYRRQGYHWHRPDTGQIGMRA